MFLSNSQTKTMKALAGDLKSLEKVVGRVGLNVSLEILQLYKF